MQNSLASHRWRFFRTGGLEQVRLETGEDLENLDQLDPKLWVALACPVKGLEFDERTLALIDTDLDGRVRVPEVLEAVRFARDRLRKLDSLLKGSAELPVAAIDESKPAGKAVLASVRQILAALEKPAAQTIGLADLAETASIYTKTRFNGDGVITPVTVGDPELAAVVEEALATVGGTPDRSGAPGIHREGLDAFWAQLAAVDAWLAKSEVGAAEVMPLGEGTAAAAAAVGALKAKVDDYFTRCRLAAYEPRAAVNRAEADFAAILATDLTAGAGELAGFPIARVQEGAPLSLEQGLNPAWAAAVAALRRDAVGPILGDRASLTEAEWLTLQGRLAAHVAWSAERPAGGAASLGGPRVRALLASTAKERLAALVEEDASCAAAFDGIEAVERLVRYHRDLFTLLQNFTSFTHFYAPGQRAMFEAGTLYLDSRSCDLCVRVDDAGKHAAMAALAKCYLAYCDLTRPGGEKMQIAAVFSGGDSDYLMVGRNGVFYDRKGRDWDATITKIVENPISIRQAFFAPYKKLVRMVEEQVAKRAAEADTASSAKLGTVAGSTANVDKAAPPARFDLSTIALIGVAVSGAAAVVGGLLEAFFGLGIWMPLGLAGIVLAISGPNMLISALKLRQRNLGPILDANGWAVNGRVQVNIPFGGSLTHLQTFPAGSERTFTDPYQPPTGPWPAIGWASLFLALTAGVTVLGYHQGWIPEAAEHRLAFLGVPKHLSTSKAVAQTSVDEARVVVASATEQVASAQAMVAEMVAAAEPEGPRMERARARVARAEAKLERALDKLDRYELRLEAETEALDAAVDAHEARIDAAEAAEHAEEVAPAPAPVPVPVSAPAPVPEAAPPATP